MDNRLLPGSANPLKIKDFVSAGEVTWDCSPELIKDTNELLRLASMVVKQQEADRHLLGPIVFTGEDGKLYRVVLTCAIAPALPSDRGEAVAYEEASP